LLHVIKYLGPKGSNQITKKKKNKSKLIEIFTSFKPVRSLDDERLRGLREIDD
jgi:hypothetical protein